jgi:hypothetical protein
MKTWKKCAIVGILAIMVFAFIACDDKNDPCNCDPKAHLGIGENCKCGGKNCNNCTVQVDYLDGIPIHKVAGISVAQMNTAVTNINNAHNDLFPAHKTKFKTEVNEIHIITGNTAVLNGTVLEVGIEASESAIYDYIVDHIIVL